MEEENTNFYKYLFLFFIIIAVILVIMNANENSNNIPIRKTVSISVDSLYNMTAKQEIKDTKIFLGFKLLESKSAFISKEFKLINKRVIYTRVFDILGEEVSAFGYDFAFKSTSIFGAIYPHFYKNKLYNLEIQLFDNDNKNINVHESIANLYKERYKSWRYVSIPGSYYWFKDGKMIIIHDNVVNYIVPKYEKLYKKAVENKNNKEAIKTRNEI